MVYNTLIVRQCKHQNFILYSDFWIDFWTKLPMYSASINYDMNLTGIYRWDDITGYQELDVSLNQLLLWWLWQYELVTKAVGNRTNFSTTNIITLVLLLALSFIIVKKWFWPINASSFYLLDLVWVFKYHNDLETLIKYFQPSKYGVLVQLHFHLMLCARVNTNIYHGF